MQLSNITVLYAVEHIWFSCNKFHLKYIDYCNNSCSVIFISLDVFFVGILWNIMVLPSLPCLLSQLQYNEHPRL